MYVKPCPSPCPESTAPPTGRSAGEAGFSLIELLIAVSLMAFLIIGVLSMNSAYIKFNQSNRYYATAVQLAENGIEFCMSQPYATLSGLNDVKNFGEIPGFADYTRIISVENFTTTTCTIRSRAAWRTGGSTNAGGPSAHWPIEITVMRTSL